ncbi:ParA family protein [Streptomyces sp. NPDC057927]
MSSPVPQRFDTAWQAALLQAEQAAQQFGRDVVVARDHLGRASLLLDDRGPNNELDVDDQNVVAVRDAFVAATHPFTGLEPLLLGHLLFAPDLYFDADDRMEVSPRQATNPGAGSVHILERTAIGTDWTRPAAPAQSQPGNGNDWDRRDRRVSLFGFKGGVGRSTATAILARYLADRGRCVLVVDLDLESPGVSNLLEGPEGIAEHGIVDHLVEAGVGNDAGLELVSRATALPVRGLTNGEVWLAPAGGRPRAGKPYDYLPKLNRIYSDLAALTPGGPRRPFSARLEQAITACEDQVARESRRPDIVLLDCRAGLHDIAAVSLTHLSGLALLFTVDNPSTWEGYRMLFEQWALRPDHARDLVDRLRIVAAMFHSAGDVQRLPTLRERSYALFNETLYGPDDARLPEDEEAPHWAIPILFGNDLIGLDPLRSRAWPELPLVEAAYQTFTTTVEKLLPPPHPEPR